MDVEFYDSLQDVNGSRWPSPRVLCAGVFDGVHLAHQRLAGRTVEAAGETGTSIVFTFANHPLSVLAPPYVPLMLSTSSRKRELLEATGIGVLAMVPFDAALAAMSPEAFVSDVLVGRFRVDRLVVGFDFRFGNQGAGHVETLEHLGKTHGFHVETLAPVREGEWVVSSTRVRELIDEGRLRDAEKLLGRPYEVEGNVVRGHGRGTKLGYPTANLAIDRTYALPPSGVYAVGVRVGERLHGGMMNIGYNPTFDGTHYSPEVFLFDYDGEPLYDTRLTVLFVQRIREERKFATAALLSERLAIDEKLARTMIDSHSLAPRLRAE